MRDLDGIRDPAAGTPRDRTDRTALQGAIAAKPAATCAGAHGLRAHVGPQHRSGLNGLYLTAETVHQPFSIENARRGGTGARFRDKARSGALAFAAAPQIVRAASAPNTNFFLKPAIAYPTFERPKSGAAVS